MPTLEWIGKSKVINHHLDVPYRVLDEQYTYNAEKSDNMIIHGDNLEVWKRSNLCCRNMKGASSASISE